LLRSFSLSKAAAGWGIARTERYGVFMHQLFVLLTFPMELEFLFFGWMVWTSRREEMTLLFLF